MNKTKVKKLEKSIVEIEGEIPSEELEEYFQKALKKIAEKIEIDGFRKGKAPADIVIKKAGEMAILEEAAQTALSEEYPKILQEEKIDAIGQPQISITKLARKNPLVFKITTAVLPEVNLPEYKSIAKKTLSEVKKEEGSMEVTDEEVENTILDIRKSRAPKADIKEKAKESSEGKPDKKEELPELNDDFVKSLGSFENVEDFKKKLKENLKLEKQNKEIERTRLKIIEKIMEESKIDVPDVLIESELQKIIYKMESDISAMGMKFEDYLNQIKKTKEDLRKEFRKDAEKKAVFSLVLHEISKKEKISADTDKVEEEVKKIMQFYKDADPERARMHAENVLTNEKVFQFLENQK